MSKSCKHGHVRTDENTVLRNGIKTCLDCARQPHRTPPRKRRKPSADKFPMGGEKIGVAAAVGLVVFDHEKVATAARLAGKAKRVVKDAAWEYCKRVVRDRDRSKCQKCFQAGSRLDVHHRKPKQMGGSDSLTEFGLANLISLCRDCHSWVHQHPEAATMMGLLLRQGDDPEQCEITIPGGPVHLTYWGMRTKREDESA